MIQFVGTPETFRTCKISEDGGGLKFTVEMSEQDHGAWEELSRLHGKPVKFTVEE